MTAEPAEHAYTDADAEARLKGDLPHWKLDRGWIRRKYRTSGWKATLMVVNTIGHLAEAAWHHPDITLSYAWVEVRLLTHTAKGITGKDFALAARSRRSSSGSPAWRAAAWKARRATISVSRTLNMTELGRAWANGQPVPHAQAVAAAASLLAPAGAPWWRGWGRMSQGCGPRWSWRGRSAGRSTTWTPGRCSRIWRSCGGRVGSSQHRCKPGRGRIWCCWSGTGCRRRGRIWWSGWR